MRITCALEGNHCMCTSLYPIDYPGASHHTRLCLLLDCPIRGYLPGTDVWLDTQPSPYLADPAGTQSHQIVCLISHLEVCWCAPTPTKKVRRRSPRPFSKAGGGGIISPLCMASGKRCPGRLACTSSVRMRSTAAGSKAAGIHVPSAFGRSRPPLGAIQSSFPPCNCHSAQHSLSRCLDFGCATTVQYTI